MSHDPYDVLAASCQEAVDELQDRCPDATVVAVRGDWAFVSAGSIDVSRIAPIFKREKALGIVRIPKDFPSGDRPYGIVTVPYLERTDGQEPRGQHRSHEKSKPVMEALRVDDVGFWSWRWEGISHSEPSDLRKAPDLIRRRLRMENA